jgi:RNA polymerase sigma factor (TIGR02999 family)
MDKAQDITEILNSWGSGNREAADDLFSLVYDELRRLAQSYLRQERPGHTLQPTALVHEAYLRLVDQTRVNWQNRSHFYGIAAQMMRRILVDHARARATDKRGGAAQRLSLEDANLSVEQDATDLIALDEALTNLAKFDERKSRVVELLYFGGLESKEAAEVLGVSEKTIQRDWKMAKLWLYRELSLDAI